MLGVRLDAETERQLAGLARRLQRTKSDLVREAVREYVSKQDEALREEAKRQSLRAAGRARTADDSFWDALGTLDDDDAPEASKAAE